MSPVAKQTVGLLGKTGFVGSAIATAAADAGVAIRVLPRLEMISAANYAAHLSGLDVVINAAGLAAPDSTDGQALTAVNVDLPTTLAGACEVAGVRRFVHLSSAAVQGNRPVLDSTREVAPLSPYATSKAQAELALFELGETSTLEISVYRPTSVQGEGRATTERLVRLLANPKLPLIGDGAAPLPLATVASVARMAIAMATYESALPFIVTHPSEGITQRSAYQLLGGREPSFAIPSFVATPALWLGTFAARHLDAVAGPWRRVEMLSVGQGVDNTGADSIGYVVDPEAAAAEFAKIGGIIRTRLTGAES